MAHGAETLEIVPHRLTNPRFEHATFQSQVQCPADLVTLIPLWSRMVEWLRRLLLNQKVRGLIPVSNLLCSCHSGGSNSYIQAQEVYFHCLPSRLSDETLNQDPESIA